MKIFVTVGSTAPFDELVGIVDEVVALRKWQGRAQIGSGSARPLSLQWYSFRPSIKPDMEWSDVVVTHAGSCTLLEAIKTDRKVIAVPNPHAQGNIDAVKWASEDNYCLLESLESLPRVLPNIGTYVRKPYTPPGCWIAEKIKEFMVI